MKKMWWGAWLSLVLIGACGAATPESVCEAICECGDGCSDREMEYCVEELRETERRAAEDGCEDEFADVLDCLDDHFSCDDQSISNDRCAAVSAEFKSCGDPVEEAMVDDPAASNTVCGNTIIEPGEQCDDGNNFDDDTCRNDCTLP